MMETRQFFTVLLSLAYSLVITAAQSLDCDFTDGNLCGWIVESQDQLHLQIMQEEQPSLELKTTSAFDSDYIFITMGQMVTKNRGASKMRIISPYFEATTYEEGGQTLPITRCFSFWYRSASWKRSVSASFTFGLQSGADFFNQELHSENSNVWRYKQIDLLFKRPTDQIRLAIDGGDTYFSYIAFDHFHLSQRSCDDSQFVIDKYRNVGGNCPGDYLAQFGQPIGCFKCSLAECLQTCEAFAFCRGASWVDRKALSEAFPGNSQCYLKASSCWPGITKFEGGYQFYERIAAVSMSKLNHSAVGDFDNGQFQALPTVFPIPAPLPGAPPSEMAKWVPRKAKDDSDFGLKGLPRLEKVTISGRLFMTKPPPTWAPQTTTEDFTVESAKIDTELRPTYEPSSLSPSPSTSFSSSSSASVSSTLEQMTTLDRASSKPAPTETSTASSRTAEPSSSNGDYFSSTQTTMATARLYSLVPSPFPNSKHIYGYMPLQPFGNCGGHFIIDENHQYLGRTRCSFAQCATLCSLSEQCRGFSFTESILVAKQCYLKTALTCEPQPSSTGFKYFIKIRKSGDEVQGVEASNGRNGIGAFTIKPVMPRQTPNSEQESRESTASFTMDADLASNLATPASWLQPLPLGGGGGIAAAGSGWSSNMRYVQLGGNCAGAFLRDRLGEAITCPRCSLIACQKLCDQDDECRGVSYSNDQTVAIQCFLKTVDTCSPLSENSGYTFYAKKD